MEGKEDVWRTREGRETEGGIGRRVGSKEGHGSSVWYRERRMNCYEERMRERGGRGRRREKMKRKLDGKGGQRVRMQEGEKEQEIE